MKKIVKEVDEYTLEMKDVIVDDDGVVERPATTEEVFLKALNCDPEEFSKRYLAYKKAKEKFDKLYEPFKAEILKIYETDKELPKTIRVGGGVKITYVSPSTRTTIDSKKLKEEEPELAKKFSKTTNVSATLRLEDI